MSKLPITMCFVSILAACSAHHENDIGVAQQEAFSVNAFSVNAFSVNAFSVNAFSVNALSAAALSDGTFELDTGMSNGIETTEDGREVLLYLSRCALDEGQMLSIEVDGVLYEFPGLLGVAKQWVTRPLTNHESSQVSACMLGHINAFRVSVPISLRSKNLTADQEEQELFGLHEATFYGELFSEDLRMYVCSATDEIAARERSAYRHWRVCSETGEGTESRCSPTNGPAFIVTGSCDQVCSEYKDGEGWSKCLAPDTGRIHRDTVNTWLIDRTWSIDND